MKLMKVKCTDTKRKLSIVKSNVGYQFIGPICEEQLDNLNKKGFKNYNEALKALKKFNYTLS